MEKQLPIAKRLGIRAILKGLLAAGLAAGTGFLCGNAVRQLVHEGRVVGFVKLTMLLLVLSIFLVDPMTQAIGRVLRWQRDEPSAAWIIGATLTFVFILGGVVEELVREVAAADFVHTAINLTSAVIVTGGITGCWLMAFRRGRFAAAVAGGFAGLMLGGLNVLMFWFWNGGMLRDPTGVAETTPLSHALSIALGNGLLFWAPLGLAGGLLMRSRGPRLAAPFALIVVGVILDWHSGSRLLYLDAATLIGWAAALAIHPAVLAAAQ